MKPNDLPPRKPIVLLPACNRTIGEHAFHVAGRKYIEAVRLAGCQPLVVPDADAQEIEALLALADGILLTGSPSNVDPGHFGEAVHDSTLPLDPERDDWALPLIRQAIARGMPLFGICRGFQETNVALGGSLHQAVHEVEGRHDHRGAQGAADAAAEQVYGPAHAVDVVPGGVLSRIVDEARFTVNSVHGQGANRLAAGLRVEAVATDGLVEAFSVEQARGFTLCVQWHPEWKAASNPVSRRLLRAFGDACRVFRDRPKAPLPSEER